MRASPGAARSGTAASSSRTSLWRILPRLSFKPASTSRDAHAIANAAAGRRWAMAKTAATTPTIWSAAMTPTDGIDGSHDRNGGGSNSDAGWPASWR